MTRDESDMSRPLLSFADGVAIAGVSFVAIGVAFIHWPSSLIVIGVALLAGWWMGPAKPENDNVDKSASRE